MKKVRYFSLFFYIFFLLLFFHVVLAKDLICDRGCPTDNPECIITCNQPPILDQWVGTVAWDYFNYSITSPYMHVKITVTPGPFVNYDPYAKWVPDACPERPCKQEGAGAVDICERDLTTGTYILGMANKGGSGNYDLSLTCENLCDECTSNNFPNDNCRISCGQTIKGLKTSTQDYVFYTLDAPKLVRFTIKPEPTVDYDPLASWTANECPTGVLEGCNQQGTGQEDTCEKKLLPGTYIFGIKYTSGSGSYILKLDCEDIPCEKYSGLYDDSATTDPRTGDTVAKCLNFDYAKYSSAKQYRNYYLSGTDCVCDVTYDAYDPVMFVNNVGINLLACLEDLNRDGTINIIDITMAARKFGQNWKEDVNDDCAINQVDVDYVAKVMNSKVYDPKVDFDGSDGKPDGKVNIYDVQHVARLVNSRWDYRDLDLDGNCIINIVDITKVAKRFGMKC